jgi:hypothetical protein
MRVLLFFLACLTALHVNAESFSKTSQGVFDFDDDLYVEDLRLQSESIILLSSRSYSGWNAGGVVVPGGGFVPVVAIFLKTGELLALTEGGRSSCDANYTSDLYGGGSDARFVSPGGDVRSGAWFLQISARDVPLVPEPSSGMLSLAGLMVVLGLRVKLSGRGVL